MRKPLQEKNLTNNSELKIEKMKEKIKDEKKIKNIESLKETNQNIKKQESFKFMNETESILSFLKNSYENTKNISLKYDLSKCIEIIQGKENIEVTDLKEALKLVLEENEKLEKKNVELMCDIVNMNDEINKRDH